MDELLGALGMTVEGLASFGLRLCLDLAAASLIIGLYARIHHRGDYVFTYSLFNLITFAFCWLLGNVSVELGFALGLFAVFGVLRYRTEAIRMRDLTYLFVVIGVGIVNAVGVGHVSEGYLVLVDVVICAAVVILERPFAKERVEEKPMTYDKIDLLRPGRETELYADIEARTGFSVRRVAIEHVDLVRDVATVTVYLARPRPK